MFKAKVCNLRGYVGQPFSQVFKLKSGGVTWNITGKKVQLFIDDTQATATLEFIVNAVQGEIELVSPELDTTKNTCKWHLAIEGEGVLCYGTFTFDTL